MTGQKEYLNREQIKISAVPHFEGLTVHDFLDYSNEKPLILQYLPEESDWLHLDRQWLCDLLYTLDTEEFQKYIDGAIKQRQQKVEQSQNLAISIRPEFARALKECIQFSNDKGRSVFMLKDSSKRKRKREEYENIKNEEQKFNQDKVQYLQDSKRLREECSELQEEIIRLQRQNDIVNSLINSGILNQEGEIQFQI